MPNIPNYVKVHTIKDYKKDIITFIFVIPLLLLQFFIVLNPVLSITFLIINLVIIGIIGERFLDSATELSYKLSIPIFIIGLILIPALSSFPEDLVTIMGNIEDESINTVILAQLLGNNLFELLIVFGITGAVSCRINKDCIAVDNDDKKLIMRNGFIMIISSILVFMLIFWDHNLSILDSIILFIFYGVFIFIVIYYHKRGITEFEEDIIEGIKNQIEEDPKTKKELVFMLILSLGVILLCANFLVSDIIHLMYNVETFEKYAFLFIGLAIGLPDLIISIIAVLKKREDIAIGLVIGSTIWDGVVSIAIQGMINPVYNISEFIIGYFLILVIVSSIVALVYIRTQWKLNLWEASALISLYILIVISIFILY
jgi:cation:H+ antiporter